MTSYRITVVTMDEEHFQTFTLDAPTVEAANAQAKQRAALLDPFYNAPRDWGYYESEPRV